MCLVCGRVEGQGRVLWWLGVGEGGEGRDSIETRGMERWRGVESI